MSLTSTATASSRSVANPQFASRFHRSFANTFASATARRSIRELLLPLLQIASESAVVRGDSLGCWRSGDELFFLPRFVFQRTQVSKPRINVAIFAGIHGDDLSAVLGLIEFVKALNTHPAIGRDYQLWLYPLCNPSGYVDGTRRSRSGKELDREFWKDSGEPEVKLIEKELREQRLDGIISLRCNASSKGLHGYIWGTALKAHLLAPALAAAEQALPPNNRAQIDGFQAIQGMNSAYHDGSLRAPPEQKMKPFQIVLEIPKQIPLRLQAQAFLVSLHAILAAYRRISLEAGALFLATN